MTNPPKNRFEGIEFKYYEFEEQESVIALYLQGVSDLKLQFRYDIKEVDSEKFVLVNYKVLIPLDGPQDLFSYRALSELRPNLEAVDSTFHQAKMAYGKATNRIFPPVVRWYDNEDKRQERIFL